MAALDLVSCLCVTRNRVPLLRRSVACFLEQTYERREMVVVYESDDVATGEYLRSLGDVRIRPIEVPQSDGLSLGALRTLSLSVADGVYAAQWDDDDWHAPTRLSEQIATLRRSGTPGCVLSRWTIYDAVTGRSYVSGQRSWEGSLVAERLAIPPYPSLRQGEDTPVIAAMTERRRLTHLERPDLYVYVFHGTNTWNRKHWLALMKNATRLSRQDEERVRRALDIGKLSAHAA
jgi:glycosyltransferase involved in cell wall biosynthesis